MDESSVQLVQQRRSRGFVAGKTSFEKRAMRAKRQPQSLKDRRSAVTLVAWVCDCPELQKVLPQFIIGNEHILPARVASQHAQGENNIFLLRHKSSWVRAPLLASLLRVVATAIRLSEPTAYIMMSMDACSVHLSPAVLRAAARQKIHLHFIPAATTRFLQPLDVAVFSKLKLKLCQKYHSLQLNSPDGSMDKETFFAMLAEVVFDVMSANWVRAFRQTGFSTDRDAVSKSLLQAMRLTELEPVSAALPTLEQLGTCWPKNRYIHLTDLFALALPHKPARRRRRRCAVGVPSVSSESTPLRHRLRSNVRYRLVRSAFKFKAARQAVAPTPSVALPPPAAPCPPPPPAFQHLRRLPVGRPLRISRRPVPTALSASPLP